MSHATVHTIPSSAVTFDDVSSPSSSELSSGLAYLVSRNIPIAYGDLVRFKCTEEQRPRDMFIFNGIHIIEMETEPDENGTLPSEFRVIEEMTLPNGEKKTFPIDYWHPSGEDGIHMNSYIWFDYRPYLDQILKNIDYSDDLYGDKFSIHSWFIMADMKPYKLVYCYQDFFSDVVDPTTFKIQDGHVEEVKQMLIEKLEEEPFFPLESHPFDDCYPEKERVLYIS